MLVDAEQNAVAVMRVDDAERAFDQLPVARFAFAQGGFLLALQRHVDAGRDDEGRLSLRVDQRGCGPGDALQRAVLAAPVVLKAGGELAGAQPLEVGDFGRDFPGRNELVPDVAPTSEAKS